MRWRRWADQVLISLFDPACAGCDGPLTHERRGPVCAVCWAGITRPTGPLCACCGDPLPLVAAPAAARCRACRDHPPAFDEARAAGLFDTTLRRVVHAFKYHGHRELAVPLAALMRQAAPDWFSDLSGLVAVPVPLPPWRQLARGFNQADALAHALGLPTRRLLRRRHGGPSQTHASMTARGTNARGAFAPALVRFGAMPHQVLLVDDVLTTGATAGACAAVLKACGAQSVRVLTVARTASRPRGAGQSVMPSRGNTAVSTAARTSSLSRSPSMSTQPGC